MIFTVLEARSQPPTDIHGKAFLIKDNWDDWGKFQTMFSLVICDHSGEQHELGSVKIGQRGLLPSGMVKEGSRAPILLQEFDSLDERYFSLGQSETYYEALNQLTDDLRLGILHGLRDCAFNIAIFDDAAEEDVMTESLLRSVSAENVRNRFHRLARGDAKLTEFQFEYQFSSEDTNAEPPVISFHVRPKSEPPTNVHVLIGRNGVGKTRCPPLLSAFIRAISDLLIKRNGVALVATHSPVVLQEIPRSCVWMLQRSGTSCVAERPLIETFGENVGILTRSIFGLEVTSSGFHQLLRQSIQNGNRTYEIVLEHFDHQLGAEARALAKSLVASRDATRGENL